MCWPHVHKHSCRHICKHTQIKYNLKKILRHSREMVQWLRTLATQLEWPKFKSEYKSGFLQMSLTPLWRGQYPFLAATCTQVHMCTYPLRSTGTNNHSGAHRCTYTLRSTGVHTHSGEHTYSGAQVHIPTQEHMPTQVHIRTQVSIPTQVCILLMRAWIHAENLKNLKHDLNLK